jgi:lysophospholipase L1-like esterase
MLHAERSKYMTVLGGLLALAISAVATEPVLRPGDRVVFLGDSITEGMSYTPGVMSYVTMRHPGVAITFPRNAGLRADNAAGSMNRLEKDVLRYKPTVVTICFGMNDGRVSTIEEVARAFFLNGMTNLITTLKAAGIRVVLMTPGCIDADNAKFWFPSMEEMNLYNGKLGRMAEAVKALGAREQLPVADMFTPMMEVTSKGKAVNPKFTIIPDGVHPTEMGGIVMSYALLSGLGYTGPVSSIQLDARGKVSSAVRAQARAIRATADSISFVRVDEALPPYIEPAARGVTNYYPMLLALHEYRFSLTDLPAGSIWQLAVQGAPVPTLGSTVEIVDPNGTGQTNWIVGAYTSDQLAAGVDLSFAPGPWLERGECVWKMCVRQEVLLSNARDFFGGRVASWMPPEAKKELDAMLKRADQAIAERDLIRKQITLAGLETTWTLTRIAKQP